MKKSLALASLVLLLSSSQLMHGSGKDKEKKGGWWTNALEIGAEQVSNFAKYAGMNVVAGKFFGSEIAAWGLPMGYKFGIWTKTFGNQRASGWFYDEEEEVEEKGEEEEKGEDKGLWKTFYDSMKRDKVRFGVNAGLRGVAMAWFFSGQCKDFKHANKIAWGAGLLTMACSAMSDVNKTRNHGTVAKKQDEMPASSGEMANRPVSATLHALAGVAQNQETKAAQEAQGLRRAIEKLTEENATLKKEKTEEE